MRLSKFYNSHLFIEHFYILGTTPGLGTHCDLFSPYHNPKGISIIPVSKVTLLDKGRFHNWLKAESQVREHIQTHVLLQTHGCTHDLELYSLGLQSLWMPFWFLCFISPYCASRLLQPWDAVFSSEHSSSFPSFPSS